MDGIRRVLTIVAATALLAGCETWTAITNGVTNPLTPEQSRTQVVDAAVDVSRAIAEPVDSATFSRSSCNDQGEAPFRGEVTMSYQPPRGSAAAAASFDQMKQRLQSAGWSTDTGLQTHATALRKNGVDAYLSPADASVAVVVVELDGECRDVTSTKRQHGSDEDLHLG